MSAEYKAIQSITVGSGGAANIEFTAIPNTYKDLELRLSVRSTVSDSDSYMNMTFNNDTGNNYSTKELYTQGSSAQSLGWSSIAQRYTFILTGDTATANTFSNISVYLPNYATSYNKSSMNDGVTENNTTTNSSRMVSISAGLWSSSAAITSIKLVPASGTFKQYSTATLYGIG